MRRMKMKSKLLAVLLLFLAAPVFAADDRFGSERMEVSRTSWTNTADTNVLIASAPVLYSGYGGELVLKRVTCSGAAGEDIFFYDTVSNIIDISTRTRHVHTNGGTAFTTADYGVLFSSGLMYRKTGGNPCTIHWDYTTPPRHRVRHY